MEQPTPRFKKTFQGIVHLKEWMKLSNGKSYAGFYGYVTVMPAVEAIGFAPSDRESNWVAFVSEKEIPQDGEDSITILGCQVRGFEVQRYTHTLDASFARVGALL